MVTLGLLRQSERGRGVIFSLWSGIAQESGVGDDLMARRGRRQFHLADVKKAPVA
jgi:hypothetical protein